MTGRLVLAGEPGFEEAVLGRIFNGRRPSDRRPEAVLLAADEADVQEGVRLAAARGWQVAVRSGGHSWAAWSIRDRSLLIDLGAFTGMTYDEATQIVSAGPAVRGGDDLGPFLEARGRFFGGGHCPSVGIGGFLLQGGQGWNARGWGWAAEQVVAVDVVTADGELVRADAATHADLYWAARGAGPTFPGVVTRFHLATRALPGHLSFTLHVYPVALFDRVLPWLYEIHEQVPPTVEIVAVSMTPENGERVLLVSALAFVDDAAEGEAALAAFRTSPLVHEALVHVDAVPTTLAEQRAEQVRANPEHARYLVDNGWIDGDPAEVAAALRPLFVDLPEPAAFTIWFSMGPLRPLPDMAFSLQSEAYVASYLVYDDEARDAALRRWLNGAWTAAQPVTVGQYLGDSDMTNRQLQVLSPEHWRRLQRVIEERDPRGRFVRHLAGDPAAVNVNHWSS
ncbi:FAD-dependent oxidoreductase [uncultured Amnibacterium sp.]|uniref:FAD-binding oxidoreductase n=1 Tax=uncultured Amnibacterium sp. TaxID=1631851 RepID=UPI0035CB83EF